MTYTATQLGNHITALLYVEGGSLSIRSLAKSLSVEEDVIISALDMLSARLNGTGLILIRTDREATLAAGQEETELLREEYSRELGVEIGEAGLEVIAIIAYRDGVSKSEIDYIRGVNTASTLRTLLARGLVQRTPVNAREFSYHPTTELLAHLGVRTRNELPHYDTISKNVREIVAAGDSDTIFHGNTEPNTTHSA